MQSLQFRQPITPLYLLNCDRKKSERKFYKAFRQWEKKGVRNQFYLSLGCPAQEPEAFAERIVFEIVAKKEDTHVDGLYFPRTDAGRLSIAPWEVGFTLADTCAHFKKWIATNIQQSPGSFEDFLRHELPARQETYLFLPFQIPADDWDTDICGQYLQWLMDAFEQRSSRGPYCIFLFIVDLRDAHRPDAIFRDHREVFDQIMELTEQNAEAVALMHPLPPVPRYYLEEWFNKVCHNPTYEIAALIDAFQANLTDKEKEQYRASDDHLFNMERIIELQAMVGHAAAQQKMIV